jgi:hypothetical protein
MSPLIHFFLTTIALLIPICSCAFIGFRLNSKNNPAWQTVACFSVLAIASSLLLLLVAGEIEFLKYGETQVNRKLDEVRILTEQNKKMAIKTVEFVTRATSGAIIGEGYDDRPAHESAVELLKASGLSDSEIQTIFSQPSQKNSQTNSP